MTVTSFLMQAQTNTANAAMAIIIKVQNHFLDNSCFFIFDYRDKNS